MRSSVARSYRSYIKIIIATGRAFTDLHELEEIPYDAVIALKGADCVLRDGTPISRKQIPEKDFQRVLVLAQHYGFALAIETNKGIFVNELHPTVIELARLVNHQMCIRDRPYTVGEDTIYGVDFAERIADALVRTYYREAVRLL